MLSPSAVNALKLAAVWIGLAGAGVLGFTNADLVRDMLGLRLEISDDDAPSRPAPDDPASATDDEKPAEEAPASRGSVGRTVELKAGAHGHFFSRIHVNGRAVQAMVDTGASIVALTFEDARSAGVHVREGDYTHRVSTANGVARVALVTLDSVAIEDIVVRGVRAAVAEPGKLTTTLLGMSFLGQLRRAQMSRGMLVLEE